MAVGFVKGMFKEHEELVQLKSKLWLSTNVPPDGAEDIAGNALLILTLT